MKPKVASRGLSEEPGSSGALLRVDFVPQMKVVLLVVACLLVVVAFGVAAEDVTADDQSPPKDPPPPNDLFPPKDLSPSEEHESFDDESGRGERIFAYYTSTTTTRLTTSTLTALSTCLSILGTATACRRRKRRAGRLESIEDEDIAALELEGSVKSVESLEELSQQQRDFFQRDDRKFTIWTTGFTTLTLTTTSYIAGTTVTATAYCITPGLTAGCFGK
ncbi:uncharacterized protein LOC125039852 [Penaeus chinensis]|uniref:uncharacterized protein LOC125039852 n=1 Tax=Penaeus chinensis TaxID=139456 RepID=UPI001FB5BB8C|nr:uncharacterized protein LOC125039852 [Penaeus chinensis]